MKKFLLIQGLCRMMNSESICQTSSVRLNKPNFGNEYSTMRKHLKYLFILGLVMILGLLPMNALAFSPDNFKANITRISVGAPLTGLDGKKYLPVDVHFSAVENLSASGAIEYLEGYLKATLKDGGTSESIAGLGMTLMGPMKPDVPLESNMWSWTWDDTTFTGEGVLKYNIPLLEDGETQTVEQSQATGLTEVNGLQVGDKVTLQNETMVDTSSFPESIVEELFPDGPGVFSDKFTFTVEEASKYPKTYTVSEGEEPDDPPVEENIAQIPTAITGLVYNGTQQYGVNAGEGFSLYENFATNAGSYTATAVLKNGYTWSDGTTEIKRISWSIAKATITKVELSKTIYPISGSAVKPTLSVIGDPVDPSEGDYTIEYTETYMDENYLNPTVEEAVAAGNYYVYARGQGNFTGYERAEFEICGHAELSYEYYDEKLHTQECKHCGWVSASKVKHKWSNRKFTSYSWSPANWAYYLIFRQDCADCEATFTGTVPFLLDLTNWDLEWNRTFEEIISGKYDELFPNWQAQSISYGERLIFGEAFRWHMNYGSVYVPGERNAYEKLRDLLLDGKSLATGQAVDTRVYDKYGNVVVRDGTPVETVQTRGLLRSAEPEYIFKDENSYDLTGLPDNEVYIMFKGEDLEKLDDGVHSITCFFESGIEGGEILQATASIAYFTVGTAQDENGNDYKWVSPFRFTSEEESSLLPAGISEVPRARNPAYTGSARELVSAGAVAGGTMEYVLGTNTETVPESNWSAEIPTAVEEGTYYVWCRAAGDSEHTDGPVTCVKSTISEPFGAPAFMLPSGLTEINESVFEGVNDMTSAYIHNGCGSIGQYAFMGCTSLEKIRIPASVTAIDSTAFSSCDSLIAIYGSADSTAEQWARAWGIPFMTE